MINLPKDRMWNKLLLILSLCIVNAVSQKKQCKVDSQCETGLECCYYHTGPMAMSKRDDLPLRPVFPVQGGWCEKYRELGQDCSGIAEMNGHCGCNPSKGLKCTWIQDLTLSTLPPLSRKRGFSPGGHSECRPATP